jgi:hypothetical protein
MSFLPVALILFGFIVIAFPQILAYLLWGFFIFLWVNLLFINRIIFKNKGENKESYVKFGNYKIYR